MFVAAQKTLAFPPWPLFAVLFVLDLAIGVAAIYVKRDKLMLAVAWITEEHAIATAAVPLLAVAAALARTQTPRNEFLFAGAIFAVFLVYPLLLGVRAKRSIHPYLAAVLASLPFFYFAREAMT